MKITILAVGKKHDPKIAASVLDYTQRLSHYTQIEWKLVETKLGGMSGEEIKRAETTMLLANIKPDATVILLDETGAQSSSVGISQRIQKYLNAGTKQLVCVIGGAYGVTDELKRRADFVWSLSPLVFPHQLVRLILIEQLYRAHTILAHEKYHHL